MEVAPTPRDVTSPYEGHGLHGSMSQLRHERVALVNGHGLVIALDARALGEDQNALAVPRWTGMAPTRVKNQVTTGDLSNSLL